MSNWRKSLRKRKAKMAYNRKIENWWKKTKVENQKSSKESKEFYGNDVWIPGYIK